MACPPSATSVAPANYEWIFSSFLSGWISFIAIPDLIQSKVFGLCRFAAKFGRKNYSISARLIFVSARAGPPLALRSYISRFPPSVLYIRNRNLRKSNLCGTTTYTFVRIKRVEVLFDHSAGSTVVAKFAILEHSSRFMTNDFHFMRSTDIHCTRIKVEGYELRFWCVNTFLFCTLALGLNWNRF